MDDLQEFVELMQPYAEVLALLPGPINPTPIPQWKPDHSGSEL